MANEVTNGSSVSARIFSQIEDDRVPLTQEAHGAVVRLAGGIVDPAESSDFEIPDIADNIFISINPLLSRSDSRRS